MVLRWITITFTVKRIVLRIMLHPDPSNKISFMKLLIYP
ncbi:hypothetical protein LINGRAHAP2_LOCUS4351 [Linum grandiflorum]